MLTRPLLIFILVALVACNATDNEEIKKTITLVEDGERKIILSEEYKQGTLLIGNTGSGKSSLTQWLAGDDGKLIAQEVEEDTGEFVIDDGDLRIGSSTNSKTTFPELVVDNETKVALYDCSGFSDNRNSSYDIASAYFMKKVADHVSHVKIVLVTSHPSVRKGVDRLDFIQLLRHATTFIKNISKFEQSLAIVVTKVDNTVYYSREGVRMVPDEKVIESIAKFLKGTKTDLENKSKSPDIDSEEKMFCDKASALLEIILRKNGDKYARIAIFRRPNKPGPLDGINLLLDGKKIVKDMLHNQLKFTEKTDDDFGYTISEKSKNYANILVEKINDRVWFEVDEIMFKLEENFKDLEENINIRIVCFFGCLAVKSVYDEKAEANNFLKELNKRNQTVSWLLINTKNITSIYSLIEKIERIITDLELSTCTENLQNIKFHGKFFNFLQIVSNKNYTTRPWFELLKNSEISFSLSKQRVMDKLFWASDRLKNKLADDLKNVANEITLDLRQITEILEIQVLPDVMKNGSQIVSNMIQEASATGDINKISDNLMNSVIATDSLVNYAQRFKKHGKLLEFLKILSNGTVETWSPSWIIPLANCGKNLTDFETWYTFLNLLYDKFSDYEVQNNKINYNVANISEFGEPGEKMQGIRIDEDNVNQFYEKLIEHHLIDYSSIPKLTVDEWQLNELNRVLEVTIKTTADYGCICDEEHDAKLTIQGDFIILSDVIGSDGKLALTSWKSYCPDDDIKLLDIYALNTIFIDSDLIEAGLQMRVISPKWKIIGNRKMNLNGASGGTYMRATADNYLFYSGARGSDGLPGVPGGYGGNFLGIGGEFDNAGGLTITANGGRGGPGQHGGNGVEGSKGKSATWYDYYRREYLRSKNLFLIVFNKLDDEYRHFGYPGGLGGKGGDGGKGGFGGLAGQIQILMLQGPNGNLPQTSSFPGPDGNGGRGGRGGLGGLSGDSFDAFTECVRLITIVPIVLEKCGDIKSIPSIERAPTGVDGIDDHNSMGRKLPDKSPILPNIYLFIDDFKSYAMGHLNGNLKKQTVLNFINQLETSKDVNEAYYALVEDLIAED